MKEKIKIIHTLEVLQKVGELLYLFNQKGVYDGNFETMRRVHLDLTNDLIRAYNGYYEITDSDGYSYEYLETRIKIEEEEALKFAKWKVENNG